MSFWSTFWSQLPPSNIFVKQKNAYFFSTKIAATPSMDPPRIRPPTPTLSSACPPPAPATPSSSSSAPSSSCTWARSSPSGPSSPRSASWVRFSCRGRRGQRSHPYTTRRRGPQKVGLEILAVVCCFYYCRKLAIEIVVVLVVAAAAPAAFIVFYCCCCCLK